MTPFDRMAARVEQRARAMADHRLRLAENALAELPDIMLRRDGGEIIVTGRGLMRRWIGDARLRFVPWMSR